MKSWVKILGCNRGTLLLPLRWQNWFFYERGCVYGVPSFRLWVMLL
jgi:hypothetical protein